MFGEMTAYVPAASTVASSPSRSPPVVPITNGRPSEVYSSALGFTAWGRV